MSHAHPKLALAAALALAVAAPVRSQQVFYESFSPPAGAPCNVPPFTWFPAGWLRANVDAGTPATGVGYVNAAWIVREDFNFNVTECAAFSTSWTVPAVAANDFMCTPAIALPAESLLSWRAVTYDAEYRDGYEVRVMTVAPVGGTGSIGNLLSSSTVVFSTAAENTTWTTRSLALSQFGNQVAHVCFRNNSFDKFLLLVDDVRVVGVMLDVAAVQPARPSEYTRVPYWFGLPVTRRATLDNVGGLSADIATLKAETLLDGVVVATDVSSPPVAVPAGASVVVTVPGTHTIDGAGEWRVRYTSLTSPVDMAPGNDTIESAPISAIEDGIARDDGVTVASLGIGADNGGELGQQFDLPTGTRVAAVRYVLNDVVVIPPDTYPGGLVTALIRAFDPIAMEPGALIATSEPFMATATGATVTAPFAGGPVNLPAGRYVVTITEPTTATLALAQSATVFTPGTQWVNWPTSPFGGWANVEEFGGMFNKPFRIELIFDRSLFADGFETPVLPTAGATRDTVSDGPATVREPGRAYRLIDATRR